MNEKKYLDVFMRTFDVDEETAKTLKYQDIPAWDSVGHMGLIAEIEDSFDIQMDTDDIIDLNSFEKGKELLSAHYNIEF